jgi:hypothetical protein
MRGAGVDYGVIPGRRTVANPESMYQGFLGHGFRVPP